MWCLLLGTETSAAAWCAVVLVLKVLGEVASPVRLSVSQALGEEASLMLAMGSFVARDCETEAQDGMVLRDRALSCCAHVTAVFVPARFVLRGWDGESRLACSFLGPVVLEGEESVVRDRWLGKVPLLLREGGWAALWRGWEVVCVG